MDNIFHNIKKMLGRREQDGDAATNPYVVERQALLRSRFRDVEMLSLGPKEYEWQRKVDEEDDEGPCLIDKLETVDTPNTARSSSTICTVLPLTRIADTIPAHSTPPSQRDRNLLGFVVVCSDGACFARVYGQPKRAARLVAPLDLDITPQPTRADRLTKTPEGTDPPLSGRMVQTYAPSPRSTPNMPFSSKNVPLDNYEEVHFVVGDKAPTRATPSRSSASAQLASNTDFAIVYGGGGVVVVYRPKASSFHVIDLVELLGQNERTHTTLTLPDRSFVRLPKTKKQEAGLSKTSSVVTIDSLTVTHFPQDGVWLVCVIGNAGYDLLSYRFAIKNGELQMLAQCEHFPLAQADDTKLHCAITPSEKLVFGAKSSIMERKPGHALIAVCGEQCKFEQTSIHVVAVFAIRDASTQYSDVLLLGAADGSLFAMTTPRRTDSSLPVRQQPIVPLLSKAGKDLIVDEHVNESAMRIACAPCCDNIFYLHFARGLIVVKLLRGGPQIQAEQLCRLHMPQDQPSNRLQLACPYVSMPSLYRSLPSSLIIVLMPKAVQSHLLCTTYDMAKSSAVAKMLCDTLQPEVPAPPPSRKSNVQSATPAASRSCSLPTVRPPQAAVVPLPLQQIYWKDILEKKPLMKLTIPDNATATRNTNTGIVALDPRLQCCVVWSHMSLFLLHDRQFCHDFSTYCSNYSSRDQAISSNL